MGDHQVECISSQNLTITKKKLTSHWGQYSVTNIGKVEIVFKQ